MRSFLIQTLEVQVGCLKSTLVSRFHFARFPVFLKLSNFLSNILLQGVQDQNLPKEIGITKKLCTSDP